MNDDRYYRHSGEYSLPGALVALMGGVAAAAILAAVYAYAVLYIPIAGFVTFILTGGFALLTGSVVAILLRRMKVRSRAVAFWVSSAAAVVALYTAWVMWVFAFLGRAGQDVSLLALILKPGALWAIISSINESGAWSLGSSTPSGVFLWIIWAAEALAILGVTIGTAVGQLDSHPFCEECESWCEESKAVAALAFADPAELKKRVEAKDIEYLEGLGLAQAGSSPWLELDLQCCQDCRKTNTLSVSAVTETVSKKGQSSQSRKELVDKLRIDSREAESLQGLARRLSAAPRPATAPAPGA